MCSASGKTKSDIRRFKAIATSPSAKSPFVIFVNTIFLVEE